VQTLNREGLCRLLCNIYYEQLLIQSRLVSAQVATAPEYGPAMQSLLLYSLSRKLSSKELARVEAHDASMLMLDDADGSVGFCFLGRREGELIKGHALDDQAAAQDLIEQARDALRLAAWGDEEPWDESKPYRYDGADASQKMTMLRGDLIRLAIRGYRFYCFLMKHLVSDKEAREAYERLMRPPGLLQFANRSARMLFPAALIYDYDFDTNADPSNYRLCDGFVKALKTEAPLEQSACFQGECPSLGQDTMICPSGFWGYRHRLGMPLSAATDAPPDITYQGSPRLFLGVWTGQDFRLRENHENNLKTLSSFNWERAATRAQALDLLKSLKPHLVYFYCHGGWDKREKIPFILVGQTGERAITPDNLGWKGIWWKEPRPLVFINGCHTTALEPDKAIEFVQAFVEDANAAGVIGTDITVFEPLASCFAEECLKPFLAGADIGGAVRTARLALLKSLNPLGLAYLPFAVASLRLAQSSVP
jgi:hypothetical protein